jgi:small subunit ribosomal protein S4
VGDIIEVRPKSRSMKLLVDAIERTEVSSPYSWLSVDKENFRGQFNAIPAATEIPVTVDLRLIVEFYSK